MDVKPKFYMYHAAVKWTEQRKGVILKTAVHVSDGSSF